MRKLHMDVEIVLKMFSNMQRLESLSVENSECHLNFNKKKLKTVETAMNTVVWLRCRAPIHSRGQDATVQLAFETHGSRITVSGLKPLLCFCSNLLVTCTLQGCNNG